MLEMMQYLDFVNSEKCQAYLFYHNNHKDAYLNYVADYVAELEDEIADGCLAIATVLKQLQDSANKAY